MPMTVKQEGRRFYLEGATYPQRDWIKANGCTWDPVTKRWWTGIADRAKQLCLDQELAPKVEPKPEAETLTDNTKLLGRVMYRGRQYLMLWYGRTRAGNGAKLAFMDGSKIFWAKLDDVTFVKIFPSAQGHTSVYDTRITFGELKKLFAMLKEEKR